MKPIYFSQLLSLGEQDRYLLDARVGWKIHGPNVILRNIDTLLRKIERLKFQVTLAATKELVIFRDELRKTEPNAVLTQTQASSLTELMGRLRSTLQAEASTQVGYILTDKRYDVKKLVETPSIFFAKDTFAKLPPLAQLDIKEAGKCIGFELPTAGAFHLLRSTEDTLRSYSALFIKKKPKGFQSWGQMITALRNKKRAPKPDAILLNHLDHIRGNFRNPTDHPDMVYDIDGAQDLFSLVIDVLNRMAKALPAPKIILPITPLPTPVAPAPPVNPGQP